MKLKNKISGEIKEFALFDGEELQGGVTLENLTKEWEDYDEPKEYWYVSCDCRALKSTTDECTKEHNKGHIQIGNYFETKEEAEKAIEKLKAWKRLKDKGFKFGKWNWDDTQGHYILEEIDFVMDEYDGASTDLDLLFGGKE